MEHIRNDDGEEIGHEYRLQKMKQFLQKWSDLHQHKDDAENNQHHERRINLAIIKRFHRDHPPCLEKTGRSVPLRPFPRGAALLRARLGHYEGSSKKYGATLADML